MSAPFPQQQTTFVVVGILDRSEAEFAFALWPGMVSIFSCVFWPLGDFLLKNFCLLWLPISLLGH
jgi:hypothetical protein